MKKITNRHNHSEIQYINLPGKDIIQIQKEYITLPAEIVEKEVIKEVKVPGPVEIITKEVPVYISAPPTDLTYINEALDKLNKQQEEHRLNIDYLYENTHNIRSLIVEPKSDLKLKIAIGLSLVLSILSLLIGK